MTSVKLNPIMTMLDIIRDPRRGRRGLIAGNAPQHNNKTNQSRSVNQLRERLRKKLKQKKEKENKKTDKNKNN